MYWKKVAILLGAYGFFKEFQPGEPFVTKFFTGPDKNFTTEQVNQEIFPVCTYANVAFLVFIFLFTDLLRYKPVLVVQGVTTIITYVIIIWGEGIFIMQAMEVLYGLMVASDVTYFTYLFAMAGREHFSDAAAISRVGYLVGRFSSGVVSQAAVSSNTLSLLQLQYVSMGSVIVAAVIVIALPSAQSSLYFHKQQQEQPRSIQSHLISVMKLLWTDFRDAFKQPYVLKWSSWWALASAGQIMVLSYVQILWQDTAADSGEAENKLWNGAVQAIYTILGAVAAWLATRLRSYKEWGDVTLAAWSLCAGGLVLGAAASRGIALQYVFYSVFTIMYYGAITVASSEVAQHIRDDSQALVYGVNTLLSTLLQTVIVAVVAGKGCLELGIRAQYFVYGGFFVLLGLAFVVVAVVGMATRWRVVPQLEEHNTATAQ